MNIYQYTAATNPFFIRALVKRYGYALKQNADLAYALKQLVATEGEPVLVEIIENHPDKELFEDYFGGKGKKDGEDTDKKLGCNGGCSGCSGKMEKAAFVGFAGAPQAVAESREVSMNTSMIMIASAIIISFAIFMRPTS